MDFVYVLHSDSRNGLSSTTFYSNSSNKCSYLTIIETDCGFVVGGYSVAPSSTSKKAFFFAISGSSCKLKLQCDNDTSAAFIANNQYQAVMTINVYGKLVLTTGETLQLFKRSAQTSKAPNIEGDEGEEILDHLYDQ